jgi:hypothetical protein
VRTRSVLLLLSSLVLAVGCVHGGASRQPQAQRLHGTVEGLPHPEHARIELYRLTGSGIVERLHGAEVTPATDGSFRTSPLLPARYLLALRADDRPVSVVTLPVPPAPAARLSAREPLGSASLEVRHDLPGVEEIELLLSQIESGVPVVDRRSARVRAGVTSLVRGLSPGKWYLDVVGAGATTELEVPDSGERLTLTISPPAVGTGAQMMGRVFREDGRPASGIAVTVRGIPEGSAEPAAWGRAAVTDSDGGYRLAGLPEGRALLRLECRDAVHARLPHPSIVTIPPSGVVRRSFVVGP